MKIILLNGPPRCGKDFAGEWLKGEIPRSSVCKFAEELKERTHAFYKLESEFGITRPHDWYEDVKDSPLDDFGGLTPREAYIGMSERYVKPMHGNRQFGIWVADHLEGWLTKEGTTIITDSGFRPEAEELVERFGADNCLLARIHRAGYDFKSDSRNYIDLSDLGVKCLDLHNDGTAAFYDYLSLLI